MHRVEAAYDAGPSDRDRRAPRFALELELSDFALLEAAAGATRESRHPAQILCTDEAVGVSDDRADALACARVERSWRPRLVRDHLRAAAHGRRRHPEHLCAL